MLLLYREVGEIRGKRFILAIGALALLIMLALISNLYVLRKINESDKAAFERYDITSSTVVYTASMGTKIEIIFGSKSVKIKDSYRINKADRIETLCFIRYAVLKRNGTQPEFTMLSGEWSAHNFIYFCGLCRDRTRDADLDYSGDKRWYVRWAAAVSGFLGG